MVCNQEVAGSIPAGSIPCSRGALSGLGATFGSVEASRAPIELTRRKSKGDLAEMVVAADLMRRGYKIAFPYGEDWDYDLIVCRNGALERVQTKFVRSDGEVVEVKCFSAALTNGRVRRVKRYTADAVDWIATYDATTDRCYYVPSTDFAGGRTYLHLRLGPARNNQRRKIRWAAEYLDI